MVEPTHLKNRIVKLDHFPNFWDEKKTVIPYISNTLWVSRSHSNRWNDIPMFDRIHTSTNQSGAVSFSSHLSYILPETNRYTGCAIIPWNNPKKLEKPWVTKGQYLAIFRVDFIMKQGAYGGPRYIAPENRPFYPIGKDRIPTITWGRPPKPFFVGENPICFNAENAKTKAIQPKKN